MSDITVYTQEVIADTAFPTEELADANTYSAETISDQSFPETVVANDLVNSSLNTQTRKILGSYSFTPTGALQVGKYVLNSSGDVRISPDGIVARNKTGVNTFTLDGDTGDATFKGNVIAGSLISGNITLGGFNNEDGLILVNDASGNNILRMDKDGYGLFGTSGKTFYMKDTATGNEYGFLGYYGSGNEIQVASFNGTKLSLYGEKGVYLLSADGDMTIGCVLSGKLAIKNVDREIDIECDFLSVTTNTFGITGNVAIIGDFTATGFKSAIVNTSQGDIALYANESPENWFMDFTKIKLTLFL